MKTRNTTAPVWVILSAASALLLGCKGTEGPGGAAGARGAMGEPGDGAKCWDVDHDGACTLATEDVDHSGACDVRDCAGVAGAAGPAGAAGTMGATGPNGAQGPAGPAGAAGVAGLRGLVGAAGPGGPAGTAGAQGPAGAAGPRGARISMTAEYELDEVAGSTSFADTSGLANPLTAEIGNPTVGSAVAHSGKSVLFNGVKGLLVAAGNTTPDSAQIWPELWIRTSDPNQTYTLLEKAGAYKLRLVAGSLEFTVTTTGGTCTSTTRAVVAGDTWTLVSGWYAGLSVVAAINHAPETTACSKGRVAATLGNSMTIGGKFNGATWSEVFRGNLDEVRVRPIAPLVDVATSAALDHPVWRWATFHTYQQSYSWWWGNNAGMETLGIAPSTWTDGNAQIDQISSNKDWLRSVLVRKGAGGKNAAVVQDQNTYYSSTDGPVTIAMFRIKNTTNGPITWTPQFAITYYAGYSERASVALNGVNVWNSGGNNCNTWACQNQASMDIPAGRTSSVLFAATGGYPQDCGGCRSNRSNVLVINNDSAVLPAGLAYVDDFDTMTGDWSQ